MAPSRPNIILILADDMGCGDIGAFGNPQAQTPALDRLADEGLVFRQHYSASPVCAPARAGLLTGRYPHRTGAIDTLEGRGLDRLALDEVTLADVLKRAGYTTGLIGKWHLGALDPRYHPNRRGFDEFAGFRGGWQDYYAWRLDRNGQISPADGRYLTDVFTAEAVAFIERRRREPFFLHVAYNAPHFPLQAPEEDVRPFLEAGLPEAVATIYAMNRCMDRGVEQILAALDRLGISDNTLVLFTSDNGPEFGGSPSKTRYNLGLNGCKGNVYEGGIRVPAILRFPPLGRQGVPSDALVHFTDWLPTLLGIAGVPVPPDLLLDGEDLSDRLCGDEIVRPPRFWQWNRYTPMASCNAAMRDGPWKLIRPVIGEAMRISPEDAEMDRRLKYEPDNIASISADPEPVRTIPAPPAPLLFNLSQDPREQRDLASVEVDRVERMQRDLDRWFEEVTTERSAGD